jgi:hypothetical protein
MQTFEEWLNEIENFSTRQERLESDLSMMEHQNTIMRPLIYKWLRAAYDVGYDAGQSSVRNIEDF